MSNVSINKKYLNLNEIRISYRVKDDSIHITSDDEDLTDSGFHLTLGKNTESEQIIRKLLTEKGLIRPIKPDMLPFFIPFELNPQSSSNEFVFGLTKDGNATWDTNLHANAFILGSSSSLPNITRNLFAHCLTHNSEWQFFGIDLNQVDTKEYQKFNRTVSSIANTLDDGIKIIDDLVAEMNNRYSLMSSQNVNTYSKLANPERKILFVIDDAGFFMHQLLKESRSFRSQLIEKFTTLLQLGQTVGIHVVLSTQRMDVVLFPESMRSHFAVRIATERIDTTPSAILFGTNVGARLPKDIKGRGLFVSDGEEKVFQGSSSNSQALLDWVIEDEGEAEPALYQFLTK